MTARSGREPPDLALLRQAVEASGEVVFMTDSQGIFTFANAQFERVYGYTAAEVVGQVTPRVLKGGAITPDQYDVFWRRLSHGETVEGQFINRKKGGELVHVEATVNAIRDKTDAIVGFLAIQRDVTKRKEAEQALQESERQLALIADDLRESQARLRLITDNVQDLVSQIRIDGTFVYVSPSYATVLGYPAGQLIGTSALAFVHPDDLERVRDLLNVSIQGGTTGRGEFRYRHADGRYVFVEVIGQVLLDEAGAPVGAVLSGRDVSARKAGEEALRQSEQRFSSAFHAAPIAMGIISAEDERFVDVNDAQSRLFDYSREEFIGRTDIELGLLTNQSDRDKIMEALQQDGFALDLEISQTTRSGELRELMVSIVPTMMQNRQHWLFTSLDVTERNRAVTGLRESNERFAVAFHKAAFAAAITRVSDGVIVEVNEAFERVFGYSTREAVGRTGRQLDIYPEESHQLLIAGMQTHGSVRELQLGIRTKAGEHRVVLASSDYVEIGGSPHVLSTAQDVTARTELQAQFLQAQKMESVGRLAGGVAHDFNNLLTVINGTAELAIAELREGDTLRADLEQIMHAGGRAAVLTRQLLAFSRKQVLQPMVLDLNTVVDDMQSMLRRLIGEDVGLTFVPAADLGRVKADPGQIEQVLLNLAVNARDAMPGGGTLTIATRNVALDEAEVEPSPSAAPGPYVMLSVSDTGFGMDEATRTRIFEPFFTTKGEGKGTGLGLSTVYGIVTQSGGTIGVYSEAGRGTSFKVYLPRVDSAIDRNRLKRSATVQRGTETILVVDDELSLRRVAERALKSAGYSVLTAANGGEALQLLERSEGPIHLMITDVVMPGISGRELWERGRETRAGMKVLFSSGYTDDAILHHGVLDDVTHFIAKPYSVIDLTRKVREVLDR